MRSNNPVFARSEEFHRSGGNYGNVTYPGYDQTQDPFLSSSPAGAGRMTIDTVVQKTALTLGVVFVMAFATWWYIGNAASTGNDVGLQRAFALMTVGSLGAFVLSMVNSFKKVISPALVLAFAALQGVALGGISKVIDVQFASQSGDSSPVTGAVIGTFAAFAGTLVAYKYFNIRLGEKAKAFVVAAMFGMVGLGLMSFVLSFFGIQTGLFGFGTLGMITAIVGLALGIFMLLMDFDFVEQGVANGLPERESWRAAFAMAVSLVWIYTNLLRLLAIFSQD